MNKELRLGLFTGWVWGNIVGGPIAAVLMLILPNIQFRIPFVIMFTLCFIVGLLNLSILKDEKNIGN